VALWSWRATTKASQAKAKVYRTLSVFLTAALDKTDVDDDCWFYSTAFAHPRELQAFLADFRTRQGKRRPLELSGSLTFSHIHPYPLLDSTLEPLSTLSAAFQPAASTSTGTWTPTSLIIELEPHLRATLIDAAPTAHGLDPLPDSVNHAIEDVLTIARNLWRAAFLSPALELTVKQQRATGQALAKFLKASSVHYPVASDADAVRTYPWTSVADWRNGRPRHAAACYIASLSRCWSSTPKRRM
jgi:hypothetical protein